MFSPRFRARKANNSTAIFHRSKPAFRATHRDRGTIPALPVFERRRTFQVGNDQKEPSTTPITKQITYLKLKVISIF
jgi:hypothetical protein